MARFRFERSVWIQVSPESVCANIDDLRRWVDWSPWEGLDPALQRDHAGPESGVGQTYAWAGNKKARAGTMQITGSTPQRSDVDLCFTRPWRAENTVDLTLTPRDGGTDVVRGMSGEQRGVMAVVGRLMPMDKLIGKDFERRLAQLKSLAE